jgi:hypothetical protein
MGRAAAAFAVVAACAMLVIALLAAFLPGSVLRQAYYVVAGGEPYPNRASSIAISVALLVWNVLIAGGSVRVSRAAGKHVVPAYARESAVP